MKTIEYKDVVTPELLIGAIENNEFQGFKEDYHVLHCLIRKYMPTTFFEIGTSTGVGCNIIANAGKNWLMKVYSLDNFQDNGERTGAACKFAYTQFRDDSLEFDYSQYPCDGYFVDGAHDYEHPFMEGAHAFGMNPKLIVWHDADIQDVSNAIRDVFKLYEEDYDLYRVTGTRIAYALRKNL